MNSTDLNRVVQFQRATTTRDTYGGVTYTWSDHGSPIYAKCTDVSVSERILAAARVNLLVCRFVIRSTAFGRAIRRTDRLVHDGMTFNIGGIKEVPNFRAFLEITATTEGAS